MIFLAPFHQGNSQEANTAEKPNIIFILVDDMGWGDLGVFWQNGRKMENQRSEPWHFTPSLDRMAEGGVMLTDHYCSAPVCAPSRASLLLGQSQGHANVRDNQFDKALKDSYTLGNVLQTAGYHTAAIGKWGLQGHSETNDWPAHPNERGFDYYMGYIRHRDGHEHYPKEGKYRDKKEVWENKVNIADQLDKCFTTDLWTAAAKKYIKEHADNPFFLYLAYDVPHAVLELPTGPYPSGTGIDGGLEWTGTPGKMINTAEGEIDSYVYPEYAEVTYDHDQDSSTDEVPWPATYQRYATSCRRIDQGIGDIMDLLQDLEIDDNTLIVFTSDNGPSRESYLPENYIPNTPDFFDSFGPFDGIKRDLWEGGVRVPTIAYWPAQITEGSVIKTPTAMYDWLPTFAEVAGLPVPANVDGISLLPYLQGSTRTSDRYIYIEYFNNGATPDYEKFGENHRTRRRNQMQKIRLGDYAGVRYNIESADDDFEIYNVVEDPKESNNLASKESFGALQQWMKEKVLQVRIPDTTARRPYDSTLISSIIPPTFRKGLQWKSYAGNYPWLAKVSGTPDRSGSIPKPAIPEVEASSIVVLEGFLQVPSDGLYQFEFESAGPYVVRLHDILLMDASYKEEYQESGHASAHLEAGFHPVKIYYLNTQENPAFKMEGNLTFSTETIVDYFH